MIYSILKLLILNYYALLSLPPVLWITLRRWLANTPDDMKIKITRKKIAGRKCDNFFSSVEQACFEHEQHITALDLHRSGDIWTCSLCLNWFFSRSNNPSGKKSKSNDCYKANDGKRLWMFHDLRSFLIGSYFLIVRIQRNLWTFFGDYSEKRAK